MKAVIMCGGAATRMRPVTETIPKPLLKVAGIPVLDIIVSQLLKNGIDELYITLGFMADEIISHVGESDYSDYVTFVREEAPLGTAGGVKNALGDTDEDVIAICGDNIFNFDIGEVLNYHKKTFSDFTIAAVECEDPSEYGVITTDDDGTVLKFTEKPLSGENDSQLINTGFYIVGKRSIALIPKNKFFDFSNDLFPLILSSDLKLCCCKENGYWGDIGDFESYITVNADVLSKRTGLDTEFAGRYFTENSEFMGSHIVAPVLIADSALIGTDCVIGPDTYIGNNCKIGDGAKVNSCICLDDSSVGLGSDISFSVLCDEASVGAYVGVDKYCALGEGCFIENYCKIEQGTRVWPRVRIIENSRASQNVFCKPAVSSFFQSSLSGTVFNEITCADVLRLGQAAASINGINKIGISTDGKRISELLGRLFSSGVLASGGNVHSFGTAFEVQSSFFASYCSLDLSLFISVDDSTANFSFVGEKGLPISAATLRKLRSVCKFGGFKKISPSCVSSEYDMELISEVYTSLLSNEIKGKTSLVFCVVCSNEALTNTLENALIHSGCCRGMNGMRIFINDEGTRMYIQDTKGVYSSEEILCVCAQREFENGKNIVLSEDSPEMLDFLASEYGMKPERLYSATDNRYSVESVEYYRNNRWIYDSLFLVCKFIGIMSAEKKSADELMQTVPRFSSKRFNLDVSVNPAKLSGILNSVGAVRKKTDVFYKIENDDANARIRVADKAGRLKILIEAKNSETAKEFAHDITMKINREINAENDMLKTEQKL